MTNDNLVGNVAGLLALGILVNAAGKVIGKNKKLVKKKLKTKDSFW